VNGRVSTPGDLQAEVVVVVELSLLVAFVELAGHDTFDAETVLAIENVVVAVAVAVHVVGPDESPNLRVLI
jgi:hypothetical protein